MNNLATSAKRLADLVERQAASGLITNELIRAAGEVQFAVNSEAAKAEFKYDTPAPSSLLEGPQTLEEAWELFDSRRFLHGHRETQRESFIVALRGSLPSALATEGKA